jgi:hypothetical protein
LVSVAIVDDAGAVPTTTRAVIVAAGAAGKGLGEAAEPAAAEVLPHPVTRHVEGEFRLPSAPVREPAPEGWTPVVRVGGKTAVAVREGPARQVWVGLDSPQWAREPGYVVFWTNVFDWVGGAGAPEFRAYPVGPLGAEWKRVDGADVGAEPGLWPGLYERAGDGARRAVNATDVRFPPATAPSDWRGRLRAAVARADHGLALGPGVLATAVACLALAAVFWAPRRTGMS